MKGAPTTPSEKASLQVRHKGVRRQNWSRLPGTSFFSSFFFFFFFCFFCRRIWRNIVREERHCGVRKRQRVAKASRRGRRRWSLGLLRPNPKRERHCDVEERRRATKASRQGRRRWSLGLLRPNPKRCRFGLILIFFKIKTPQNDFVLGFP